MRTSKAHDDQSEAPPQSAARREAPSAGADVPPPLTADMLRAAQRGAGNAAVAAMIARRARPAADLEQPDQQQDPGVHKVLASTGRPLPAPVRKDMEARFDTDFSDVRLHTGPAAAGSADAIGARAYTSGSHVVLGAGGGLISVSGGAFIGAVLSFGLVLLLSHTLGGTTDRVVLAGVAAMQLFSALTSFIVMTAADAETTRGILFWLLGSLSGADWTDVAVGTAILAAALLICVGQARTLDAFAFGQDAAMSLGVSVARTRLILLCTTALLTAALVSSAGAIGFVGLVLPHATRALTGPGHTRLLPATALAGAVFLVWVDTLARTVLAPQEVPVGVVTSLIGVPAFVAVLYRTKGAR